MIKNLRNVLYILLAFLAFAIIYSCKRDIASIFNGETEVSSSVQWAKDYYTQNLQQKNNLGIKALSNGKSTAAMGDIKENKKTPIWAKSTAGVTDLYTFVEVPLKYEHKITPTIGISNHPNAKPVANQEIIDASFDRLIIFKDKNDKVSERIISFVPDVDYLRRHKGDIGHNKIDRLDKDFYGYLHYKDWEGKALFILRIENGKSLKKYSGFTKNSTFNQNLSNQGQGDKVMVLPPEDVNCTYLLIWDWYQDSYYSSPESTVPTHCDPVVVYNVDYILLHCDPPAPGGPSPEPEIIDCSNPIYFYTAECEEGLPDSPCKHAKQLAKDALFRSKFQLIKDSISRNVERAYIFKFGDNSYIPKVGGPDSVDVSINSPVDGFFHIHRVIFTFQDKDDPNTLTAEFIPFPMLALRITGQYGCRKK